MDGNTSGAEGDGIDWDTEDDLEIESCPISSCLSLTVPGVGVNAGSGEASSSAGPSNAKLIKHFVGMGFPEKMVSKAIEENGEGNTDTILEILLTYSASSSAGPSIAKLINHFVGMGFPEKMVSKAIEENGEENTDTILETLLTYSVLENSPEEQINVNSDSCSSEYAESFKDDLSDADSFPDFGNEDTASALSEKDNKLLFLVDMGYPIEVASIAIQRCAPDSSIDELTDFICAAQMAREQGVNLEELPHEHKSKSKHLYNKKRKQIDYELWKRKKNRGFEKKILDEDNVTVHLPNPMIGFGVPTEPLPGVHRTLPEVAIGPPYFYFENVACTPKGTWNKMSRFLYEVEPEFVDSQYFCACQRKRGYIHNLPIQNRFPLLPLPPRTIHEVLPLTRKWWPSWDTRIKFRCLQTVIGSAKTTERIRKALEDWDGEPPLRVQKDILDECKRWNLVWVGKNKVATLEPDEVEMLLGFPKDHTRGGGISRTDRYKSLGNSFQVDTVAYHLSVLKYMFPSGIKLLSLLWDWWCRSCTS